MALFGPFEYSVRVFAFERPYRYSPPPVFRRKERFVAKPKRERMLAAKQRLVEVERRRQQYEAHVGYLRILREQTTARLNAEPTPTLASALNDAPRNPTILSRIAKLIGFSRD